MVKICEILTILATLSICIESTAAMIQQVNDKRTENQQSHQPLPLGEGHTDILHNEIHVVGEGEEEKDKLKELAKTLCDPDAIKFEKLGQVISDKPERAADCDAKQPSCIWFWSKTNRNEGDGPYIAPKTAIRLAIRKFLCDHKNKVLPSKWEYIETDKNLFKLWTGTQMVEQYRREFMRNDPELPHQFQYDFKFTVFYSTEFKGLWDLFKVDAEKLLVSLTSHELKECVVSTKGQCQLFTSSDGKYFFKSVWTRPKNLFAKLSRPLAKILEPVVERDFFFEQSGDHFSYWPHRDRVNNKESSDFRFRGGFLDYLAYMEKLGPEMLTLLPKYFMLFYFEPIVTNPKRNSQNAEPILFTVQNGLFPQEIMPKVNLKFDLKGSSIGRYTTSKEAEEKIAQKKEPNLKDLNFRKFFPIGLELKKRKEVIEMLQRDSKFLADLSIIDYSLLMGVRFQKDKTHEEHSSSSNGITNDLKHKYSATTMHFNNLLPLGIPTKGKYTLEIFIGIIDILQPYILKKKMESVIRGATNTVMQRRRQTFDPSSKEKHEAMSVTSPLKYQSRFMEFLKFKVFKTPEMENIAENDKIGVEN